MRFTTIFRGLMVFYPRLKVLNVPETSLHDYTRITHADGSTFLTNYPPLPAGKHGGLVSLAGPAVLRSARPGPGKWAIRHTRGGAGASSGVPARQPQARKIDLITTGGGSARKNFRRQKGAGFAW